jgi:hypothetical protein
MLKMEGKGSKTGASNEFAGADEQLQLSTSDNVRKQVLAKNG